MASKEAFPPLPATHSGLRPSDFPLGSMESRAAARAMLSARSEQPQEVLRLVVTGTWEPIPEKNGAWRMPPLDLEKSTCSRTLDSDGTLWEFVKIHGNRDQLTDEALAQWIERFPIERRKS
jgi:hypothetical protein